MIIYDDVAIVGDNLRNTIIRPANAGKDLFRVRNGCYVTGFAMKDNVDAAVFHNLHLRTQLHTMILQINSLPELVMQPNSTNH